MNELKLAKAEQGLNGAARKVLAAVPIGETWTRTDIIGELRRCGANIDASMVEACLNTLRGRGLITEPKRGTYRRIEPRIPSGAGQPDEIEDDDDMTMHSSAGAALPVTPEHMDRMGALASSIRQAAAQLGALPTRSTHWPLSTKNGCSGSARTARSCSSCSRSSRALARERRRAHDMSDDKPTIPERYGLAVANGVDIDIIMAAAMQRHAFGVALLRLRSEYDTARGDLERAGQIAPRNHEAAEHMRREAAKEKAAAEAAAATFDDALAEYHQRRHEAWMQEAAKMPRRTRDEVVSARAFILIELKSLAGVKTLLHATAMWLANKPPKKIRGQQAMTLAGHVLDVFLDSTCQDCDGTGRHGSRYLGQVETICKTCGGTGQRRYKGTNAEINFCRDLHEQLDQELKAAAGAMKRALLSTEAADSDGARAVLRARLDELGAVEAQED